MKYTIIESHPYFGSFNADIANTIEKELTQLDHSIQRINLVSDEFNPVMSAKDLKLWSKGESSEPLVTRYQSYIGQSNYLIFIFPIWWGCMPAVLKGFCDKVLLPNWAYKYNEDGEMIGLLDKKKAIVITTMQTPIEVYKNNYNDPIKGAFIKGTLETCGIEVLNYFQIDQISTNSKEDTENKLNEIITYLKESIV